MSEEVNSAKGDLRALTLSLLQNSQNVLSAGATSQTISEHNNLVVSNDESAIEQCTEQILLIDEVDVFFSPEFYGNTYNLAVMWKEPDISEILKKIWAMSNEGTRRVKLSTVKQLRSYQSLIRKFSQFESVIENEIMRMINEVRRLDETPYHLDTGKDRIGHKVMDAIDYDVNYGYRTIFAYLKEMDSLKNPSATLQRELGIKLSCGQFSYASIAPAAILGVSGTLRVIGTYEKNVLRRYGVESFFYLPSVYGESRFCFDKADPSSIFIEKGINEYLQKISEVVVAMTMVKRAAIVFFANTARLNQFISSPFYKKLGRNKNILMEDMSTVDKEFVIQRAATSTQITLSIAVFGRGTDFFCKDETVEKNGGVHVVQAFLSAELSEEIQMQGRTARQGKKGTYSMVLLEEDLKNEFGATVDEWPRKDYCKKLNECRQRRHENRCQAMESNLAEANSKHQVSQNYFDALLRNDSDIVLLFKNLYQSIKKRPTSDSIDIDMCFAVDNTGSMREHAQVISSTISSIIQGQDSILNKLKLEYPYTKFKIRLRLLAYKDFDDGNSQFNLCTPQFIEDAAAFIITLDGVVSNASGGGDICEDHLGAIHHFVELDRHEFWESTIKMLLLFTDAPCHGFVPASCSLAIDNYNSNHPLGLTTHSVAETLQSRDIDLFICSLNQKATLPFEEGISRAYRQLTCVKEDRGPVAVPIQVSNSSNPTNTDSSISLRKHFVFVLDESGSMQLDWSAVVVAYNNYRKNRLDQQCEYDLVSVVQFENSARITVQQQNIAIAPLELDYHGGGTYFFPAAAEASKLALDTPESHVPVLVFMSDGHANDEADAQGAVTIFSQLNQQISHRYGTELELHVVRFGTRADISQLKAIANTSAKGQLHSANNASELSNVFVQISNGSGVANILDEEIACRVYDTVNDRLSAEYAG